jgi:hypothetical protein
MRIGIAPIATPKNEGSVLSFLDLDSSLIHAFGRSAERFHLGGSGS